MTTTTRTHTQERQPRKDTFIPIEKGHPSFASHCLGQQRFSSPRGAGQQHALGQLATQTGEFVGILQVLYDFLKLILCFIAALDIRKRLD